MVLIAAMARGLGSFGAASGGGDDAATATTTTVAGATTTVPDTTTTTARPAEMTLVNVYWGWTVLNPTAGFP